MTPDGIYFDLIHCEDKSADLYLDLSIRFSEQMDLSWFWIEMAMKEKQQAGLLQYCLENKVFARDLPDIVEIRDVKRRLDDLGLRASDPNVTVDNAFDIAIQVETSGLPEIRSRLTTTIEAPAYVQQKKVELLGGDYSEKLRSAADRFAVSEDVRSKLAKLRCL
jgi:hypothetical protein